ncbi:hypothetical protein GGQ54_001368 [Naumannella cuiyingiana]|uniref:ApeA N-terminal domain-containing protein n=1 Tax=Naumannella cuiyingiana TaxID=1347891 RepID=A0A7Z0D8D2_9ACTN|nr:hypothetical protein [Naumannella cuiyingiana]NYI70808.1 hypothetical protein [Naumannella cuiyingiana]
MTESFDCQGRWWLPEHQDHKVFGTFRWDPASGGTLELQGELTPIVVRDNLLPDGTVQRYRERPATVRHEYAIIRGQVERKAYTLLDSFQLSLRELDLDDSIQRVHVNRLLEGAWYDDPSELVADRVVIDLRHLTGWVKQSGLSTDHPRHEAVDDDRFSIVTARILPTLTVAHGDTSVRLFQSLSEKGDHVFDLGIAQHWSLSLVRDEPWPVASFIDIASDIQDLISIAVGKTANFDRVSLQHPALPKLSLAGTPLGDWREDITYHAQWFNRTEPCDPVKAHDMYFTLEDLGGMAGIGRWLDIASRYRTELSRVMATRYSASMFLEDRIMNISAALDSFDKVRRRTGDAKVNYVDRVLKCIDLAGEPFTNLIASNEREWAKFVKEARHDIAHHRQRFRLDGTVGENLLAEQLYWLFVICILRSADAPPAVFHRISEHAQVRWLVAQATVGDE